MKKGKMFTTLLIALAMAMPMAWQQVQAADGRLQHRAPQQRVQQPRVQHRAPQQRASQPRAAQHKAVPARRNNQEMVSFKGSWLNTPVKGGKVHGGEGQIRHQERHLASQRDHRIDNSRNIEGNTVYINNKHNRIAVPANRHRVYRDVVVVRPYGHWYNGYGNYYDDNDAWKWLAFTAITLKILDNLNEAQQREHEAAQVQATTAPLNQPVAWSDGNASGSVTAVREGTSNNGRYCREFQQTITVAGQKEDAYGTACQNPDGSWELVSD